MRQFVLQQNIMRFKARLAEETDEAVRRTIAGLLIEADVRWRC